MGKKRRDRCSASDVKKKHLALNMRICKGDRDLIKAAADKLDESMAYFVVTRMVEISKEVLGEDRDE